MGFSHTIVFVFAVIGTSLAFTGEYIPKSYYLLYPNGEHSPVVPLRERRSVPNFIPLIRMRRSDSAGSGSGSGSFATSGSFSGAGGGGGADAVFFPEDFAKGFEAVRNLAFHGGAAGGIPGFPGGIPGGIPSGAGYAPGADGHGNGIAPNLHSRFGGDDGVSYSGQAQGARGVYSASSSSIDGDGNVKYSVKTGKL